YPEQKNRRKKNQQIDRDQGGEADPDHGAVSGLSERAAATSFPHSTVAIPQMRLSAACPLRSVLGGKRHRARYFLICSSRAGSPAELWRKQYRTSPFSLTAIRNW